MQKNIFFIILESFFYEIDLFKTSFLFYFSKRRKQHSNIYGTILSIFIFTILFFSFLQSDMIQRTNPSVLSQDIPQINRPAIYYNRGNFEFHFALGFETLQTEKIDYSIFNITVSQTYYILNKTTNSKETYDILLPYNECNLSDIPQKSSFNKTGLKR